MIICSCEVVSDAVVRQSITEGARTIEDVATLCGAGSRCQGCWPALQELLDQAARQSDDLAPASLQNETREPGRHR